MKAIAVPVILAVIAHSLSWAFTAFFLHELRYEALDTGNTIAEIVIISPIILTAIATICAIVKGDRRIVLIVVVFTPNLGPVGVLVLWDV